MSGHSKFANIKHKKEKNDAKKGKIFTVIGRELVMAVKAGGPDPNNNSKLRDVIAKAKANNMPNDTIERGIKKAAGADSADQQYCRLNKSNCRFYKDYYFPVYFQEYHDIPLNAAPLSEVSVYHPV